MIDSGIRQRGDISGTVKSPETSLGITPGLFLRIRRACRGILKEESTDDGIDPGGGGNPDADLAFDISVEINPAREVEKLAPMIARRDRLFTASPTGIEVWKSALPAPPEGPRMEILRSGTEVVIRWPDSATGFGLYLRPDFGAPWQVATGNPGRDGAFFSYTNRFPFLDTLFDRIAR